MIHTRIVHISPIDPDPEAIGQAAEVLRRGGLVAFPTETVYGLGADVLILDAVKKVFEVKGRIVEISGAGHSLYITHAKETLAAIRASLAEVL